MPSLSARAIRSSLILIATCTAVASHAEQLTATPGQPLCIDQDSLARMLLSGVLASHGEIPRDAVVTDGCQTLAGGTNLEVVERYASGSKFMRVIKVKASSPRMKPTVGYTVEIDQ